MAKFSREDARVFLRFKFKMCLYGEGYIDFMCCEMKGC